MKHREKPAEPMEAGISPLGWKAIAAGLVLIAIGFFVLSHADRMGQNWAALVSPFLILGGYGLVGLGLFLDP